jgi:hypothetical protein
MTTLLHTSTKVLTELTRYLYAAQVVSTWKLWGERVSDCGRFEVLWLEVATIFYYKTIEVFLQVRTTRDLWYPEFGPKPGWDSTQKNKPAQKYNIFSLQTTGRGVKLRNAPLFLFCFVLCQIEFHPVLTSYNCTTTIITLEPCSLHAEFQHFIPRFNKNFPSLYFTLGDLTQRGGGG